MEQNEVEVVNVLDFITVILLIFLIRPHNILVNINLVLPNHVFQPLT